MAEAEPLVRIPAAIARAILQESSSPLPQVLLRANASGKHIILVSKNQEQEQF